METLENQAKLAEVPAVAEVTQLPQMFEQALGLALQLRLRQAGKIKQIVICGMGGSAISGDLVQDLLAQRLKAPILVNRNYSVPAFVDSGTVLFALSYSGNTEETLAAVKQAQAQGAKIVCVTSGGKLKQFAEAHKLTLCLIPGDYQPRAALPFLLVPVLKVLNELKLYPEFSAETKEAQQLLQRLSEDYNINRPARSNPAKQLAKKMLNRTPLIFASTGTTAGAGLRFKCQLNENAKVTALLNVFPELNHNELVNLNSLKRTEHNYSLVILRDPKDNERIKKRIEITKSLLSSQLGGAIELEACGKSALARIMSLVVLGDFASLYLAVLRGVEPSDVSVITKLKKELQR